MTRGEDMVFTKAQRARLKDGLNAYVANFGSIRIEKADFGEGYYIFSPADSESYVNYSPSIDNLDGWLWGMVQAANKVVPKLETKQEVNKMCIDCTKFCTTCRGDIEKAWTGCLQKNK